MGCEMILRSSSGPRKAIRPSTAKPKIPTDLNQRSFDVPLCPRDIGGIDFFMGSFLRSKKKGPLLDAWNTGTLI